jgi:hypothetical protein
MHKVSIEIKKQQAANDNNVAHSVDLQNGGNTKIGGVWVQNINRTFIPGRS